MTLLLPARGEKRGTATDPQGGFVFAALLPARYRVEISAPAFRPLAREDVNLTGSERLSLGELALTVGATTESVPVTAQAAPTP